LLLTIPQASVEVGIGNELSVTLSAFKGSYTFLSESHVRGVNLLLRKYFSDGKGLSGFYGELGPIINGEFLDYKDKWKDDYGARVGVGWQFGSNRLVFDFGGALASSIDKYELFDQNGLPSGEYDSKLEAYLRIDASVGFRF
jgi:outer membrane receptor protein involved in Fe transport